MITVGIDEVGRGCWAGPLVAGAVILREPIEGLKDSKKLSKRQREELTVRIRGEALAIGLGWVWPAEIDAIGITESVRTAMARALEQITTPYDRVIIDGNINYLPHDPRTVAIIKADDTVPAVSAASIVAKVARDTYMATTAVKLFPEYGFEKHVGYGTALHIAMLAEHGVTAIHRKSYKPIQNLKSATI
jgi:ribonuclease HII